MLEPVFVEVGNSEAKEKLLQRSRFEIFEILEYHLLSVIPIHVATYNISKNRIVDDRFVYHRRYPSGHYEKY